MKTGKLNVMKWSKNKTGGDWGEEGQCHSDMGILAFWVSHSQNPSDMGILCNPKPNPNSNR